MKNLQILQILIIVFFISLAIFALTNIQVHADGVTQPIKVTMGDSAPSATVTVTDLTTPGAPSPSTFSSDGSVYSINGMSSGDSFTLSFSNAAGSTQDGFNVSSVFSSTSITYSVSGSQLNVTAYEQVSNNFTVTGLSGADSVTLAGTYLGAGSSPIVILNTANGWNASAWSDYGYAVTFPASSASSTGTERWSIGSEYSTGSLTAGDGTYSQEYYHQYLVTANYTTSDDSTPSADVTLSGTSLDSSSSTTLTTTPQLVWLDAGSSWSVNNPITAGSGTEQWIATSGTSGTVGSATVVVPSYYHQYSLTMATNYGSTSPSVGVSWHDAGSGLDISASAPVAGAGARYVWGGWAGIGVGNYTGTDNPTSGSAVTMDGPVNETASWTHQYEVTFVVSPSGSGSTSPAGTNVWEDTGSLGISATANSGYSFSTWSSNTGSITFANANFADTTATINGPGTITATFTLTTTTTYSVTFTQTGLPAGKSWSVTFNSVTQSSTTSTIVFSNIASGRYSWSVLTPIAGSTGIQYQASRTSGTMNVPSQTTQRITYTTQFYLTVSAYFGSVNPSSGWYAAGSKVTLSATSPRAISGERYVFNGWTGTGSGSYTGTRNPASNVVTMNGPITEVASWAHQYQVTVTASPTGAIGGTFAVTYTMSGTTYTHQQHNTPWTQWTDASTTVTVSSPQSPYKGYTFSSYTNNPATMNSAQTITLMYYGYGALNHFVFNTISTQTAGTAFTITITAKDAYGNTVLSYDGSTTLTETGGGAGGTVSPSSVTFTNGVYTGNVYVTKSGTGVTITATHGSTRSASNTFTVNPGALSHFVFNTMSTQTAGTAFRITITTKDAYGNTVTSYASSVGLSSSTGIGAITPTSTGTSGWLNGVWSGSVRLTTASSRVTITANDGSGHTGTSNPFTVRSH